MSSAGCLIQASGYLLRPLRCMLLHRSLQSSRTLCVSTQLEDGGRALPSFDELHTRLTDTLNSSKYVKATHVNLLFNICQSLEQLEKAKGILASFRKSPSHYRNSMPMIVIKTCKRLGVFEDAFQMIKDPVKYGLFPMNNAMDALLLQYALREDIQGIQNVIQLMEQREMEFTGRQHYLLAKVSLKSKLRKRKGAKVTEGLEELESEGVEGGTDEVPEKQTETKPEGVEPDVAGEESAVEVLDQDAEQAEVKLEDLKPILELCKKAFSLSEMYGKKAYYGVNGILLSAGEVQLASEMIEKVETEDILPENLIMNMKVDTVRLSGDLQGTLALLRQMKEKDLEIPKKRLPHLHKLFQDENIRQSFLDLKLDPPNSS